MIRIEVSIKITLFSEVDFGWLLLTGCDLLDGCDGGGGGGGGVAWLWALPTGWF